MELPHYSSPQEPSQLGDTLCPPWFLRAQWSLQAFRIAPWDLGWTGACRTQSDVCPVEELPKSVTLPFRPQLAWRTTVHVDPAPVAHLSVWGRRWDKGLGGGRGGAG